MYSGKLVSAAIAGSLALLPAQEAAADAGDFIAGAIIGGIVGANAKQAPRKVTRSRLPSTQEGREIQASLNYFGFPAGTVDGQLGSKSRQAISMYQAYMGWPVSGHLTPLEQSVLVTAYNRAQIGGYAVTQQMASHPDGMRGLLKVQLSDMTGAPVMPVMPQPAAPQVVVAPQPDAAAAQPEPMTTEVSATSDAGAMPSFMGGGTTKQSLVLHCNTVNLVTNSNGGFVTLANMEDPNQALNEQFCLARSYAMSNAELLSAKVQGFTPDQVTSQCQGLGPTLQPYVTAVSLQERGSVLAEVGKFVLGTGMQPQQLISMAEICLGVGYRLDDMNVALGSGLLLVALGEGAYGELMGHHLSQGIGTARRPDLAQDWYQDAITAMNTGQKVVFSPGQPERNDLILEAAYAIESSGMPGVTSGGAAGGLPSFGTGNN